MQVRLLQRDAGALVILIPIKEKREHSERKRTL